MVRSAATFPTVSISSYVPPLQYKMHANCASSTHQFNTPQPPTHIFIMSTIDNTITEIKVPAAVPETPTHHHGGIIGKIENVFHGAY